MEQSLLSMEGAVILLFLSFTKTYRLKVSTQDL